MNPAPEIADDVLIARIARSGRVAMRLPYGRHHVRVYRFGVRLCGTYHEKSVKEVAGIVGIPENTVKARLFYARKKLAVLLQAAGIERG